VTCIVAMVDNNSIYMGADRGASDDDSIVSLSNPKVYIKGDWIFGFSGSLGTGQLMQCITLPIVKDTDDVFVIVRTTIVKLLKDAIDIYGSESSDHTADFLIGCKGRLFEMSTEDWGVVEVDEVAIGSGGAFALGSLYSTKEAYSNAHIRMTYALNAAITYSPTCQGPIDILYI
jgi:ATP-dependent protease HslVU (ClpYQ) peptidase subunit